MSAPLAPIPNRPFALVMGVTSAVALGLALLASWAAGGDAPTLLAIAGVMLAACAVGLVALIGPPLVTPTNWALVVLASTMMQTMLALGAMLVLIEISGLPRRPVVIGLLAGTFVLMIGEAVAAVWLLARRDRLRTVGDGTIGGAGSGASDTGLNTSMQGSTR